MFVQDFCIPLRATVLDSFWAAVWPGIPGIPQEQVDQPHNASDVSPTPLEGVADTAAPLFL